MKRIPSKYAQPPVRRVPSKHNRPSALVSRNKAAMELGGLSASSMRRMEADGRLTPIRPTGKASGRVFYAADEVAACARSK